MSDLVRSPRPSVIRRDIDRRESVLDFHTSVVCLLCGHNLASSLSCKSGWSGVTATVEASASYTRMRLAVDDGALTATLLYKKLTISTKG